MHLGLNLTVDLKSDHIFLGVALRGNKQRKKHKGTNERDRTRRIDSERAQGRIKLSWWSRNTAAKASGGVMLRRERLFYDGLLPSLPLCLLLLDFHEPLDPSTLPSGLMKLFGVCLLCLCQNNGARKSSTSSLSSAPGATCVQTRNYTRTQRERETKRDGGNEWCSSELKGQTKEICRACGIFLCLVVFVFVFCFFCRLLSFHLSLFIYVVCLSSKQESQNSLRHASETRLRQAAVYVFPKRSFGCRETQHSLHMVRFMVLNKDKHISLRNMFGWCRWLTAAVDG